MAKNKFDWTAAHKRSEEIQARLNELAEGLEADQSRSDFTPEELAEQKALLREQTILDAKMRAAGLTDVTLKLWPGCRHEVLNETNRDKVMADIATWMEERL